MSNDDKLRWIIDVEEDPETGDLLIPFPADFLTMTGWVDGTVIEWVDNHDGSWTIQKKD